MSLIEISHAELLKSRKLFNFYTNARLTFVAILEGFGEQNIGESKFFYNPLKEPTFENDLFQSGNSSRDELRISNVHHLQRPMSAESGMSLSPKSLPSNYLNTSVKEETIVDKDFSAAFGRISGMTR